jgi:hypothetical protein
MVSRPSWSGYAQTDPIPVAILVGDFRLVAVELIESPHRCLLARAA